MVVYLLDDTHQRVSYVMEEIFLHIDMDSRRSAPTGPRTSPPPSTAASPPTPSCPGSPTLSGSMSLR